MADESTCNKLLPQRVSDLRKNKKRNNASATDSKLKANPGNLSCSFSRLPPQDPGQIQVSNFRATDTKPKDNLSRGSRKAKERQRDSKSHLAATRTTSNNKVPAHVMKAAIQTMDSLRWEGALPDPQEEEKRLEHYRANRRQRYITHREGLWKEAHYAMRETKVKTSTK
ncbi:protein LIAT1 [Poecilia formosa]|uniref:protein LIAT1 n=1 Tax=Poecilia formosa TaxID=48698 RepID=UPI0004446FB2|nr:PREDICTED: protein LIAT1 [Poecilia formosa]XP_016529921.1 PREDICTED: protein LIAT1 [Poecilia formosa]